MSAPAAKQEGLKFPAILVGLRRSIEGYRAEIRSRVVALVRKSGKQEAVGRAMGFDPGNFSKALSGAYAFDIGHLADLRALDEDNELIRFLCALWGGVFTPKPELSPEEELAAYKRALAEMGLELVVRRRALGPEDAP